MIQPQGTGTPPDTTTDEACGRRSGVYQHGVVAVAEPGANRHYGPDAVEAEVTS